ncbi:MAG TPA: hypothetical protein VMW58_15105 [Anaerolineae bacterium]|nr:hypothetical protein [Anaerolineae bacterium]
MRFSRIRSQPRLWLLLLIFVTASALLANMLVTLALSARASGPDYHTARLIPNTDVNPFGANMFLDREVEEWKLRKTLEMASEAGLGWVKQQFPWEEIEPVQKGEFYDERTRRSSWEKYDRIVDLCEEYGLQIIARLDRPPDWTREDNTYKERPPDVFEDYGDFVFAFVDRYRGRIKYVQIWNEPNIFPEWGNRPVDPAGYVNLLRVAYERAKEADPNVYVLSAPLAITLGQEHPEPGEWISMNEIEFLEKMYKAGAKDYFDILSANAFGLDSPPEEASQPRVLNFQRVVFLRDTMERHGDAGKPIWFNEYGWNASPEDFPEEQLVWQRVSEQYQADYTVRGIEYAQEHWPWAGVFNIWYFRQVGSISPDRSDYYFRVVDVDFTPRLVYHAIKEAAVDFLRPVGPGYYQETNPALVLNGDWEAVIEPQASGEAQVMSDAGGSTATLSFVGENADLIATLGPKGGRLAVSLDKRPVDNLPRNGDGQSYVDLFSPVRRWQQRIPLVYQADDAEHTLVLTVLERANLASEGNLIAIDGLEITRGERPSLPYASAAVLALVVVATGGLTFREWRLLRRRAR